MSLYAPAIARLIEEFQRLPGIGPKSAQRLAFFILRSDEERAQRLADAIVEVKRTVKLCSQCFNLAEGDLCEICASEKRDRSVLCVVEEPRDVVAIERSGGFCGLYHVLHGAISPMDGIGPEQLKMRELVERVGSGAVKEVIVATNPNVEGETTALYIARLLRPLGVRVTRIASGLPVGGDLEYADEVTLSRALEGRRDIGE
ncbi:recombination mediator RecR [Coriobacteriia bacterium Es71-Z0120]|uniref:recombination mediator RecR n=1 Tax=Parvivirga hydrogeniphila TaxID=2939460 RepID=UPI00226098B9|nr:recombination mediator RecR [Parvivirga hydrogeniphila]MCL4078326.1 recombination mediator RecR [Parvivirga hydrogeniphila]